MGTKTGKKRIDEFDAVADNGDMYHIIIFQTVIDAGSFQNPLESIEGLKQAMTSSGLHCNFIDENTFEVLGRSGPIRVMRLP